MPASRPPNAPEPERPGDDLKRIAGIGPAVEGKLAAAGIRTYADIAGRTPEALATILGNMANCSAERIAERDWIGQAERLQAAPKPSDDTHVQPLLHVSRLTRALPDSAERPTAPGRATLVGLELTADRALTMAEDVDYALKIAARPIEGGPDREIRNVHGVMAVGPSLSMAMGGRPLPPGRYQLVAVVQAFAAGHAEDADPIWSGTVTGDEIEVAEPKTD